MYVRMVIGEAISDDQIKEFVSRFKAEIQPEILEQPGIHRSEVMIEEGGRMVLVITYWNTRDACLKYHASRGYRQFVAKTQHLLLGDFVVKLFRTEEASVEPLL